MNEEIVKGKWKEIKGEIQKAWGRLTNDELEKAKGNMTAISGLIQQKYGHSQTDINKRLDELTARFKTSYTQ